MDLIADATFLVGIWRRQSWATRFATHQRDLTLGIPWVVLGEFWHGAVRAGHDESRVREFLSVGLPLFETEVIIPRYARLCTTLQNQPGWRQVGQNDLWIAAAAIAYRCPLVTRNLRHFDLMPALEVKVIEAS